MTDKQNKPTKLDEPARKTGWNPGVLPTIQVEIAPPAEDCIIVHIKPDTPEQLHRKALLKDTASALGCEPALLEAAGYSEHDLSDRFGRAVRSKKRRLKTVVASVVFAAVASVGLYSLPEREKEPAVWLFLLAAATYGAGRVFDWRPILREDAENDARGKLIRATGRPRTPPKAPPPPPHRCKCECECKR